MDADQIDSLEIIDFRNTIDDLEKNLKDLRVNTELLIEESKRASFMLSEQFIMSELNSVNMLLEAIGADHKIQFGKFLKNFNTWLVNTSQVKNGIVLPNTIVQNAFKVGAEPINYLKLLGRIPKIF
jgi:hypothetical protein